MKGIIDSNITVLEKGNGKKLTFYIKRITEEIHRNKNIILD